MLGRGIGTVINRHVVCTGIIFIRSGTAFGGAEV